MFSRYQILALLLIFFTSSSCNAQYNKFTARFLILGDTDDNMIGCAIQTSVNFWMDLIEAASSGDERYNDNYLVGADFTEKKLFDHYRRTTDDPNAVLICIILGHGE